MQLDWEQIVEIVPQLLTHVVGFLILVWLVRRYAWKKLLAFVEQRRQTIENSFADIAKGHEEVAAQKRQYEQELENIEAARRAKIQDGVRQAEKVAGGIREEARQEAVAMRQKAKQDIALEVDKANVVLRDRVIETVLATVEKVMGEKLDKERHARLIEDFLNRMKME